MKSSLSLQLKQLLLLAVLLLSPVVASGQYTLTGTDVTIVDGVITKYLRTVNWEHIVIPDTLQGQAVIGIGEAAFFPGYGAYVSAVKLPSTIEFIRENAFYDNYVRYLNAGNCSRLKIIGQGALKNNQTDSVNFTGCHSLEEIHSDAFSGSRIRKINLTNCTALRFIGTNAFSFLHNDPVSTTLPVNVDPYYSQYGWIDDSLRFYESGDDITDFTVGYHIPAPYTLKDDDLEVQNGTIISFTPSTRKEIIIPDSIEGQSITGIGETVFQNRGIWSVTLPSSLITIGKDAFSGNRIMDLNMSTCNNLTTIGKNAFRDNQIDSLNILDCTSLTYIDMDAFTNNLFTSFSLPVNADPTLAVFGWKDGERVEYYTGDKASNTTTWYYIPVPYTLTDDDVVIENGILLSCSYNFQVKEIIIPDTLDGQAVCDIGQNTFYNKPIIALTLPSTLTNISSNAFQYNKITHLDMSACSSLIYICENAFQYNDIDTLDLSNCTALRIIRDWALANNKITNLDMNGCTSLTLIEERAFFGNPDSTIILPVHSNPEYASYGWMDKNEVQYESGDEVPSGIPGSTSYYFVPAPYTLSEDDVVMKDNRMVSCSWDFALINIIIPDTLELQPVEEIENMVFSNKGIRYLTLPSTLKRIRENAFSYNPISSPDFSKCSELTFIGEWAFFPFQLGNVDLRSCTSLSLISELSFSQYDSLILPAHSVSEFAAGGWKDHTGGRYNNGDTVTLGRDMFLYLPAIKTHVPDDYFEQALIDLGYDPDGELNDTVPTALIQPLRILDISNKGITDPTGIKDFTDLTLLKCQGNELDACALDFMYHSMPDLTGKTKGKLVARRDYYTTNPGVANSNTSLAASRNWMVCDLYYDTLFVPVTGDGSGCPDKYYDQELAVCENELPYVFGEQQLITPGVYTETFMGVAGNDSTVTIRFDILAVPGQPVIVQDNDTLRASEAAAYHWYLEGVQIENQTGRRLVISENGNYSVKTENEAGCLSEMSETVYAVYSSIFEETEPGIRVYPNPVKGLLYIEVDPRMVAREMKLYNHLGQTIWAGIFEGPRGELDMHIQRPGMYILEIKGRNEMKRMRVLKSR
jgi:hypothetical protein